MIAKPETVVFFTVKSCKLTSELHPASLPLNCLSGLGGLSWLKIAHLFRNRQGSVPASVALNFKSGVSLTDLFCAHGETSCDLDYILCCLRNGWGQSEPPKHPQSPALCLACVRNPVFAE